MAFARLKNPFSRGLDGPSVVGRESLVFGPQNENFEFNYFLETTQVPHILRRGLNRNEINVWEEGSKEKDGSLLADKAYVASGISRRGLRRYIDQFKAQTEVTRRGAYVPLVKSASRVSAMTDKLLICGPRKLFTIDVMTACLLGLRWQTSSSRLGNRRKSGWAQIGITALLMLGKYAPVNAVVTALVTVPASSMIHNVCREGRAIKQPRSILRSCGICVMNVL